MEELLRWLEKSAPVSFVIASTEDQPGWLCAIQFGEETPGSEMAAGMACGMGNTPLEALTEACDEIRVNVR